MSYKIPLVYNDILDQDKKIINSYATKFSEEIKEFAKITEILISFFSNSKRTYREEGAIDLIQLIAVRIFHDTRSAFELSFKGLYPQAASLIRSSIESIFLIYDFKYNPANEDLWFNAGKNKREEYFKLGNVLSRLQVQKLESLDSLKKLYDLLSFWSVHINLESYLWYVEPKGDGKTTLYHWAGHEDDTKKAECLVFSSIFALSHALFIVVEEDLYTITEKDWLDAYETWKKSHLSMFKKYAELFGVELNAELDYKPPKIVVVKP